MDLQFLDLIHLSRDTFNASIEVAMARVFQNVRKVYPTVKNPTAAYCANDAAIKVIFERRNAGWPIIAYTESAITRSWERGSPVNMYREGQIGKLLDKSLTNYTTLKLIPQDITHDLIFLTNNLQEKSAFVHAWGVFANTSGLKFDLVLDEIGLRIPIGASLDEALTVTSNEDPEVPYIKIQTSFTLKTFTGEAQTVPAIHGTLQDYLTSVGKTGPSLPLDQRSISFRNPSSE